MSAWVDHIFAMPAWLVLLVVFAMPALESSAFVGFFFPGEVTLVLGGVVASRGHVAVGLVIMAAVIGCVLGDSVGFAVGRRYGQPVLDRTVGRLVKPDRLTAAQSYLARRGGLAVFLGRFTATLRVLVPGLAGMSGMRYRTFAINNVAGSATWGPMSVLIGYFAGNSWRHVSAIASRVGLLSFAALIGVLLVVVLLRRLRRRPDDEPLPVTVPAGDESAPRREPPGWRHPARRRR